MKEKPSKKHKKGGKTAAAKVGVAMALSLVMADCTNPHVQKVASAVADAFAPPEIAMTGMALPLATPLGLEFNDELGKEATPKIKIPKKFEKFVQEAGERFGVDPMFIAAVIQQESKWRPRAISGKDCKGLMQLKESTAADMAKLLKLGDDYDIFDARTNILLGTKYISVLSHQKFIGDVPENILVSYNYGMGNFKKKVFDQGIDVETAIKRDTLPRETKDYVHNIMENYRN